MSSATLLPTASDMSNLLLLLAIVAVLGMATFLTLCLRRQNDLVDDARDTPVAPPVGRESADMQLLMQSTVDQLEDIATLLRDSDAPSEQGTEGEPPGTANASRMTQPTLDELTRQANQLLLRVALEVATHDQGPGGIAGEIRRLSAYDLPDQDIDPSPQDRENEVERNASRPVAEPEHK